MLYLTPFAISGLLIVITYVPLFAFLLIKGKTKTTRIYSLHILAVIIWGIGSFILGLSNLDKDLVNPLFKAYYPGVLFIAVFFVHSVLTITEKKNRLVIIFSYVQALVFIYLTLTDHMIKDIFLINNSFYFVLGNTNYLCSFIIWELLVGYGHFELIKYYKQAYPEKKKQISLLIFAGIGFIGGTTNFLPALGINIYPFGNFLVPIHCIGITYAILKHQFLDIEIVYKKGLLYSILLSCVLIGYLLAVIAFEKFFQHYFGYNSLIFSVAIAFIIGILFTPFKNKLQDFIDKLFLSKSPKEILEENKKLRQEIIKSEQLKTITMLASGMAHEIKNPLTSIKTFTEFLPQKINDQEFIDKFGKIIPQEVDRIDKLVHELLDFAKPTKLHITKTNARMLIEQTLDFLNNDFFKHNIRVARNFQEDHHILAIDSKQIRQAILNILLNAKDAMPLGGLLEVTAFSDSSRKQYTISIKDTGVGIDKEDIPHIFDPFFSKKDNGTGLGLSITYGIIQEHKGRIAVESVKGIGTTFVVELPLTSKMRENRDFGDVHDDTS